VVAACRPHGRAARFLEATGPEPAWRALEARAPGALQWHVIETSSEWGASAAAVGVRRQHADDHVTVGAAAMLGRLDPNALATLAEVAEAFGAPELRITPWRGVVLIDISVRDAEQVVGACEALGLTCDPRDPATAVVTCAGSAGCAQARADVQTDARRLIARLAALPPDNRVRSVHVSGCEKGCARAQPAEMSLVASDDATYDVYAASPRDPHAERSRFGQRVRCGLTTDDAIDAVSGSRFA
jgi:precorrin-3B synthase